LNLVETEKQKYDEVWTTDDYKDHSPGQAHAENFLKTVEPHAGQSIIDIGCGQGLAGLRFEEHGLRTWYLDLTDSALENAVPRNQFIQSPIWGKWQKKPLGWDYGYCCDVMEHIPPEFVMLSLDRIVSNCRLTWFMVCNKLDSMGEIFGKPLHLTVQPYLWWKERIAMVGTIKDARDLAGVSMFLVSR